MTASPLSPSRVHRRLALWIVVSILLAGVGWGTAKKAGWLDSYEVRSELKHWRSSVAKKTQAQTAFTPATNPPPAAPQPVKRQELPRVISKDTILTAAQSPYGVIEELLVAKKATLTVEPGVEIGFEPGARLVVLGQAKFQGASNAPIRLRASQETQTWAGLFIGNDPRPSTFVHVRFDNAVYGIKSVHARVHLDHVATRNVRELYSGHKSDTVLSHCRIAYENYETRGNINLFKFYRGTVRMEDCDVQCPKSNFKLDAFDVDAVSSGVFLNNRITGSQLEGSDGIDIGLGSDNVVLAGNLIMHFVDKAVSVGEKARATITNNVFAYCGMGLGVKDRARATVAHCTFYQNQTGIDCFEKTSGQGGGQAAVAHCLFVGNKRNAVHADAKSNLSVTQSIADKQTLVGEGNRQEPVALANPDSLNFNLASTPASAAAFGARLPPPNP